MDWTNANNQRPCFSESSSVNSLVAQLSTVRYRPVNTDADFLSLSAWPKRIHHVDCAVTRLKVFFIFPLLGPRHLQGCPVSVISYKGTSTKAVCDVILRIE
jgi:hypothetical protein